MISWSREDLAWAAGLFEGEGTITMRRQAQRGYSYEYWGLAIAMTDEDVVRRFHEVIELGRVTGPVPTKGGQPIYIWRSSSQPDIYAVLAALYPWLGGRRRSRAEECLRDLGSRQMRARNRRVA